MTRLEQPIHLVDLGNIRLGETLEDTHSRLMAVCEQLLAFDTIPLVVGGSHDLVVPIYQALGSQFEKLSIVSVDARIDMDHEADSDEAGGHVLKIIQQQPNRLYNYTHLAYQSFHTDYEITHLLEKLHFDHLRLGRMRDDFGKMEPLLRACDLLSFDVSALRKSDFGARGGQRFFGLHAEEACQLAWYAGLSNQMKAAGFFEYNPDKDEDERSAYILASMMWYFLEGISHRKTEDDFHGESYFQFIVQIDASGGDLVFYKHKYNQRWWLEIMDTGSKEVYRVPCDRGDYDLAAAGQVPDVYIKAVSRLK
jgi:formiminoglutamase